MRPQRKPLSESTVVELFNLALSTVQTDRFDWSVSIYDGLTIWPRKVDERELAIDDLVREILRLRRERC